MNERPSPEARVPITSIRIVDRHRKDLGDLDDLADSIGTVGLIQPIVLTTDRLLIAGHRRVEACRRLGWDTVPAVTAEHLFDAADRLRAERDENTCRKAMTPSELVALGLELEALERPKALARQRANHPRPGERADHRESLRSSPGGGTLEGAAKRANETASVVSEAVGMGRSNYYKARAIVLAAEDPDEPPHVREAAQAARRQMDETGSITPAYEAVRAARDSSPDTVAPPAPKPAPRARPVKGRRAAPRANVASAVSTLRGLAVALDDVDALDPAITNEEAAAWDRDLSKALRVLRSFHTKVKEHANGNR